MRIRKCLALGGAILIFLGCLIIYRMTDYTLYLQEQSIQHFEMESHKNSNLLGFNFVFSRSNVQETLYNRDCPSNYDANGDIEMDKLYQKLNFDNIDGGVWKQGWDIKINAQKWNDKKILKVFIVPHSHNDPGWLKTFEDYYLSETKSILNNILSQLDNDPKKKFIWAEISYFSLWWNGLSQVEQEKVKRLIQRGQLEIVTGGWVMNDEANTHYYSIITQLTEGHQWMKTYLDSVPKNAWTIDPFGESPVMAYLLKKTGIKNLVIQRVHYSVKKYLAQTKNLEFWWKQTWDRNGLNDMFTHMTPFYSYDIPHTCGPDPKICCQFDFKRLPGNALTCPWKESPKPITKKNVAFRANLLLDQYRKKSELYRSNVLLVPLGDDFRYQTEFEWNSQFENYYKILEYINGNPDLYADIRFGTLADFFNALSEESTNLDFPSLTGDFFTYADRDDHYWSGFYTSRPFYKKMDRILMGYHRAAEIIFSLGWSNRDLKGLSWLLKPHTRFIEMLQDARQSLSLFQHHDGITGTARDNVMEDYAQKMANAIAFSKHIIQQVSYYLLSPTKFDPHLFNSKKSYFVFDDENKNINNIFNKKEIIFLSENESKILVFFNSLLLKRKELVSFIVSSPFVQIIDHEENIVQSQVTPLFSQDYVMDNTRFEVSFIVKVPALGLISYKLIRSTSSLAVESNGFSKIKIYNSIKPIEHVKGFEPMETGVGKEFFIDNDKVTLAMNEKGLLKSVIFRSTMEVVPLHLNFFSYRARKGKERSGAYLFLPDGEASIVKEDQPLIRVLDGPLFSRVELVLNNLKHFLTLYHSEDLSYLGIEIINFVDILRESNYELAMRLTSDVKSGDKFYSDLNGFQMIKRTRLAKIPIQGNFYPMPTAAYIEDEKLRISVVSGQPLGVSSLREGELEILQDRRLLQDDNRGLGQGVLDNKITPNIFRIQIEKRKEKNCQSHKFDALSINSYLSSQSLLNPVLKMISVARFPMELTKSYSPIKSDCDIDLHLVAVRTFYKEKEKPGAGLVFHRPYLDTCFLGPHKLGNGRINLQDLFPKNFGDIVKKSTLSFLKEEKRLGKNQTQTLCIMDFLAVILS